MDYSEFSKKIKTDEIGGAYLLHGGEEYIKDLAVKAVLDKYVAQGLKDINYDKLDGAECETSAIESAVQPLPFMSPKRVVTVHSMPLFSMSAAQFKQNAKTAGEIQNIIEKCPLETVLLFVARGQASPASIKLFSAHKKDVEFKSPNASKKGQYVARMAGDTGLKISRQMIGRLIDYTGAELLELDHEISKLKAYVRDGEVTKDDIYNVCSAADEYNIFKMLKMVTSGDGAGAISEYRKLILSGQSPQAVISMIERQFRALFYMDEIKAAGQTRYKDMANKLSTKDFVIRNMEKTSRGMPLDKIKKIAEWCADADYLVKRGELTADSSAEMLIMKLIEI